MTDKPSFTLNNDGRLFKGRFRVCGTSYHPKRQMLSVVIFDIKEGAHHHCFKEEIATNPDREKLNGIIKDFLDKTF